jgi:hypothetical protein
MVTSFYFIVPIRISSAETLVYFYKVFIPRAIFLCHFPFLQIGLTIKNNLLPILIFKFLYLIETFVRDVQTIQKL